MASWWKPKPVRTRRDDETLMRRKTAWERGKPSFTSKGVFIRGGFCDGGGLGVQKGVKIAAPTRG